MDIIGQSISAALEKLNNFLVTKLEKTFNIPVFQDQVREDEMEELQKETLEFFIYETGGFTKQNEHSVSQEVLIKYFSENRDDLDARMLDIAGALDGKAYNFKRSVKTTVRKADTDEYVDYIELYFTRVIKYGC